MREFKRGDVIQCSTTGDASPLPALVEAVLSDGSLSVRYLKGLKRGAVIQREFAVRSIHLQIDMKMKERRARLKTR